MPTLSPTALLAAGLLLLAGCTSAASPAPAPPPAPARAEVATLLSAWPAGDFQITGHEQDYRHGVNSASFAQGTRQGCRYEERTLSIPDGLPATRQTQPPTPRTGPGDPPSISYRLYVHGTLYTAKRPLRLAEQAALARPGAGVREAAALVGPTADQGDLAGLRWVRIVKRVDQDTSGEGVFPLTQNLCEIPEFLAQSYSSPRPLPSGVSQIEVPGTPVQSLAMDLEGHSAYLLRSDYEALQGEGRQWNQGLRKIIRETTRPNGASTQLRESERVRVSTSGQDTALEFVLLNTRTKPGGAPERVRSSEAGFVRVIRVRPSGSAVFLPPPTHYTDYVRTTPLL